MRLSYDGGRNYPRRLERALSAGPPPCAAAVYVYDDAGDARVLAADFDVKRAAARGALDPAGQVAEDAAAFAALVRSCGGIGLGDVSPNGGRHGYVLWAAPVPYGEMRRVALALARRYCSYDPSPMLGQRNGIIRPPGSRHRTGGFQELTTPAADARRAVRQPNGPGVWERLCEALSQELAAIERGESPLGPGGETAPEGARQRTDEAGAPWLPRPGGPVLRLRQDLELTAITGAYDTARYPSTSEARFAVLGSGAARGWRLADVASRMRDGRWPGLAGFYAQYRGAERARELAADWKKAVAGSDGGKTDRACDTRGNHHGGGTPGGDDPGGPELAFHQIRRWDNAVRARETRRWPGAHGITVRLVLRGLGAAAQMSASMMVEFGTRSLGMLACVDHSTVARVLRELAAEDDPYLELLAARRGVRGDLYQLRIPESCGEAAAWRRWRPGRIGVHPVFSQLGGAAALVCEQLAAEPVRTVDLPALTGLSSTTVSVALAELGAHGIAVRSPGGWRRGPVSLDDVATSLGVPEILAELQARYRQERQEWRAFLMIVTVPPAPAADDDVPWPGEPPEDDGYSEMAAARAPPASDTAAGPIAILEAQLGAVRVITAA